MAVLGQGGWLQPGGPAAHTHDKEGPTPAPESLQAGQEQPLPGLYWAGNTGGPELGGPGPAPSSCNCHLAIIKTGFAEEVQLLGPPQVSDTSPPRRVGRPHKVTSIQHPRPPERGRAALWWAFPRLGLQPAMPSAPPQAPLTAGSRTQQEKGTPQRSRLGFKSVQLK